jgi:hypothetical protein
VDVVNRDALKPWVRRPAETDTVPSRSRRGIRTSLGGPWQSRGNIYRHEYEAIFEAIVWNTVQHDTELLLSAIEAELARLPTA